MTEEQRLPIPNTGLSLTTSELEEKIWDIKVEIDWLQANLNAFENELFYRKNPECRYSAMKKRHNRNKKK